MPKKTKLTRNTSYAIHNKVLETSDTSRHLGVSITDNLPWSRHTAIAAGKANKGLGFLRRNINDCSTKVKAISYTTMVRPIMEHASAAWDPQLQKDISQLERVKRRAARFCCCDYTNRTLGCVDDMLKVLTWESLETRRKNNRLSRLHKINTGHVDITLDQYLQRSDPRTRGAQRFRHARADHPALYHSFFHATLRQWNRLPTSLSATTCPEAFRTGFRALTSALMSS